MRVVSSHINPLAVSVCLAAALAVAWMIGAWLARRRSAAEEAPHSKFGDAAMALLGLLLAFTFGTSIAKNDQRRLLVIRDANAIGAFYTSASLLDDPFRADLQSAIRQYTQTYLRLSSASHQADSADAANEINTLQVRTAGMVGQVIRHGTPISVPLVNGLNGLEEASRSEIAGTEDRLPVTVVSLLFFSALAATLLIAREHHRSAPRDIAGTALFILMVCAVIYVSADLNRPLTGLARVSQAPMERLLASMAP